MSTYWLGVATLPAIAIALWLAAIIGSRLLDLMGRVTTWTVRRIRPDEGAHVAARMGAVMYGTRRGLIVSQGKTALILAWGLDDEKRRWAEERLRRQLRLRGNFPNPTTPTPSDPRPGRDKENG